jgi:hypothetical protein
MNKNHGNAILLAFISLFIIACSGPSTRETQRVIELKIKSDETPTTLKIIATINLKKDMANITCSFGDASNRPVLLNRNIKITISYRSGPPGLPLESMAADPLSTADYFVYPKEYIMLIPESNTAYRGMEAGHYIIKREKILQNVDLSSQLELEVDCDIIRPDSGFLETRERHIGVLLPDK